MTTCFGPGWWLASCGVGLRGYSGWFVKLQNKGNEVERIYGCVTTGTNWKFLFLEGTIVYIDEIEYYIKEVDKILGILLLPFQPVLMAV